MNEEPESTLGNVREAATCRVERKPRGRDREREFALDRGTHLISDGRGAADAHGVSGTAGKLPGHDPRANVSRMSPAKPAERYVAPTYTTVHLYLLIGGDSFPSLWPPAGSSRRTYGNHTPSRAISEGKIFSV